VIRARRLAAIAFLFAWPLAIHGKSSASGDEPHPVALMPRVLPGMHHQ
jgi:hypothetical protein